MLHKKILNFIERFLTVYFLFIPIYFIYRLPIGGLSHSDVIDLMGFDFSSVICIIIMLGIFFSLEKITVIYHEALRKEYIEKQDTADSLKGKIFFIITNKQLWIEVGAFAVLYLILPVRFAFGHILSLIGIWEVNAKLIIFLLVFPAFLLLKFLARLSAFNFWKNNSETKQNKIYSEKRYIKQIAAIYAAYSFAGIMIKNVVLFTVQLFKSAVMPSFNYRPLLIFVCALAFIIFLFYSVRNIRAFIKRVLWFSRLKKFCASNNCVMTNIKRPLLSVFFLNRGENFSIYTNKQQYSCKLICAKKRILPLYLNEEGQGSFRYVVQAYKIELFTYTKSFNYNYESKDAKILTINPVPKEIRKIHNEKIVRLDNGYTVGSFKIYTGSAFINSLERQCLNR